MTAPTQVRPRRIPCCPAGDHQHDALRNPCPRCERHIEAAQDARDSTEPEES